MTVREIYGPGPSSIHIAGNQAGGSLITTPNTRTQSNTRTHTHNNWADTFFKKSTPPFRPFGTTGPPHLLKNAVGGVEKDRTLWLKRKKSSTLRILLSGMVKWESLLIHIEVITLICGFEYYIGTKAYRFEISFSIIAVNKFSLIMILSNDLSNDSRFSPVKSWKSEFKFLFSKI